MNILSLFDGLSALQIALNRLGVQYDSYFASEIDKYAIKIAQKNYPNTIQLSDVRGIRKSDLPKIFLLGGGSPCQDLSIAQKNRKGLKGERSGLFYEYLRIRDEVKPEYFLLENVASMSKENRDTITSEMGVEPIMINSSLVSAQHRKRLYWTNIPNVVQPEDRHIYLCDILESGEVDVDKSYCIDAAYYKGTNLEHYLTHRVRQIVFEDSPDKVGQLPTNKGQSGRIHSAYGESITITANGHGIKENTGLYVVPKSDPEQIGFINQNHRGSRVYSTNGKSVTLASSGGGWGMKTGLYATPVRIGQIESDSQGNRVYGDNGKSQALTANPNGGTKLDWYAQQQAEGEYVIRKLTPRECERLQTIPDDYTEGVSNTQRYKMLGNSFTVDVIAHILSFIPEWQSL